MFDTVHYFKVDLKLFCLFRHVHVDMTNFVLVFRSDDNFKELFAKTGMVLVKEEVQRNFPSEIYRVKM